MGGAAKERADVKLSLRLKAIVGMVTPGPRVIDVGTDHALVPIALVSGGRAESAVAADIAPGPLAIAEEHIREKGLEDRIRTVLSDVLDRIDVILGDQLIISGMGGYLMSGILKRNPAKTRQFSALVLSPQSDAAMVRHSLKELGFTAAAESMIEDKGKFYQIIRAVPVPKGTSEEAGDPAASGKLPGSGAACRDDPEGPDEDARERYGPVLLDSEDPVLKKYLIRRRGAVSRILEASSADSKSPGIAELYGEYRAIIRALEYYH